jgi:hypothetical protein
VGAGFQFEPGLIDNLAKMLHNGADSLIAKQVDAAGEIAVGVGAAADAVAQGGKAYTKTDNAARQALPHPK